MYISKTACNLQAVCITGWRLRLLVPGQSQVEIRDCIRSAGGVDQLAGTLEGRCVRDLQDLTLDAAFCQPGAGWCVVDHGQAGDQVELPSCQLSPAAMGAVFCQPNS